ncbi:hypothetical protein [Methanomassiliicoccus luminyensis]|uniref:hypothetical protein n=1 Tax=Methanomassiliicoccus luminyensis TaxID=1080712 RepID=UPI0003624407|nr:hypothetical protein [Methanomassiliicoccus luminyensis]
MISAGHVLLYKIDDQGTQLYLLKMEMGIFNSLENATDGYENTSAKMAKALGGQGATSKNVTVGDGGVLFAVKNYVSQDDRTSYVLLFRERNVICTMEYSPLAEGMAVTEQDVLDAAKKQIDKL